MIVSSDNIQVSIQVNALLQYISIELIKLKTQLILLNRRLSLAQPPAVKQPRPSPPDYSSSVKLTENKYKHNIIKYRFYAFWNWCKKLFTRNAK